MPVQSPIDVSIVIPLYDEEKNVALVHSAITKTMLATRYSYEVVFVDDGSADSTFSEAARLTLDDARVRVIKFRKNYGQTAAISAGIRAARGDVVVTMDGDLQNDPDDISLLLERINDGYHIVVGWRHVRQDEFSRVWLSIAANWIIAKLSGVPVKDLGCSLKAYRAELIQNIPLYSEMHRFIPIMTSMSGARMAEVKVSHHSRRFGRSKYGFSRILKVALDIISIRFLLSFSERPIMWSASPSIAAAFAGGVLLLYVMLETMLGQSSNSIVVSSIGILFLSLGIFLFAWGLIGYLILISSATRRLMDLSLLSLSLAIRTAQPSGRTNAR